MIYCFFLNFVFFTADFSLCIILLSNFIGCLIYCLFLPFALFTEGLNAKFQWFTVLYGIECSFGANNTKVCLVHEYVITKKLRTIPYHIVNH